MVLLIICLKIDKSESKSNVRNKINSWSWTNDEYKKIFLKYFNKAKSFEDIHYMTIFMQNTMDINNIGMASIAVVDKKGEKTLSPNDKFMLIMNKIYNSNFDILDTAKGIISKFSGTDKDFKKAMVQSVAVVDDTKHQLQYKPGVWNMASPSMGGNETISYILKKDGYTLVQYTE